MHCTIFVEIIPEFIFLEPTCSNHIAIFVKGICFTINLKPFINSKITFIKLEFITSIHKYPLSVPNLFCVTTFIFICKRNAITTLRCYCICNLLSLHITWNIKSKQPNCHANCNELNATFFHITIPPNFVIYSLSVNPILS